MENYTIPQNEMQAFLQNFHSIKSSHIKPFLTEGLFFPLKIEILHFLDKNITLFYKNFNIFIWC